MRAAGALSCRRPWLDQALLKRLSGPQALQHPTITPATIPLPAWHLHHPPTDDGAFDAQG